MTRLSTPFLYYFAERKMSEIVQGVYDKDRDISIIVNGDTHQPLVLAEPVLAQTQTLTEAKGDQKDSD